MRWIVRYHYNYPDIFIYRIASYCRPFSLQETFFFSNFPQLFFVECLHTNKMEIQGPPNNQKMYPIQLTFFPPFFLLRHPSRIMEERKKRERTHTHSVLFTPWLSCWDNRHCWQISVTFLHCWETRGEKSRLVSSYASSLTCALCIFVYSGQTSIQKKIGEKVWEKIFLSQKESRERRGEKKRSRMKKKIYIFLAAPSFCREEREMRWGKLEMKRRKKKCGAKKKPIHSCQVKKAGHFLDTWTWATSYYRYT